MANLYTLLATHPFLSPPLWPNLSLVCLQHSSKTLLCRCHSLTQLQTFSYIDFIFFPSWVSFVQAQCVESAHGKVHMVRREEGRPEHNPCAAEITWTRNSGGMRRKSGREVHFLLCWVKGKTHGQKDRPALQKISTTKPPPECCQRALCYRRIEVQSVKRMSPVQKFLSWKSGFWKSV